MDQYKNFKAEDFVWDSFFRQWILAPTRESDMVWKNWLSENPELTLVTEQAKKTVLALNVAESEISEQEIDTLIRNTVKSIDQAAAFKDTAGVHTFSRIYHRLWFQVAASVLILIVAGLWFKSYNSGIGGLAMKTKSFLQKNGRKDLIEKVNDGAAPMVVWLDDSSRVTLAPKSRISYPEKFAGSKREVSLNGEAFFEIAKDPQRPFFVYANELITKVLGTSFTIKAYDSSRQVTVEVKTGRVSVFATGDPDVNAKLGSHELDGVILSPNQKIIFKRDEMRMVKTLVEKPVIILPKAKIPHFEFEDTPASEAFASIGKAYGIDILYDEDLLSGCPLTASLDNQSLHDKLTIICAAVEASYEILDGQIIIHSTGCRN